MIGFFFFQAEDGIRDYKVTGVQTCALPIFQRPRKRTGPCTTNIPASGRGTVAVGLAPRNAFGAAGFGTSDEVSVLESQDARQADQTLGGRASCRRLNSREPSR